MVDLNTYKILDSDVFYASLSNQMLTLLPDGIGGAWMKKENNIYYWLRDYVSSFDILDGFDFIRQEMIGKALFIYFKDKTFNVKLCYNVRVGGYKELEQEVVYAISSSSSVKEALSLLNKKLKLKGSKAPKLRLLKKEGI